MRYENQKILKAAKGQPCQMRIPGECNGNPETTVAAHSGLAEDGAGMGIKADDIFVAFSCSSCHDVYDGRKPSKYSKDELKEYFTRGMKRTWRILIEEGVLK